MKSIESYKFEMYPLTTLFIGSQEAWEPYEYILKDGKVVKFKSGKLLDRLNSRSLADVERFAAAAASQPVEAVAVLDKEFSPDLVEESPGRYRHAGCHLRCLRKWSMNWPAKKLFTRRYRERGQSDTTPATKMNLRRTTKLLNS